MQDAQQKTMKLDDYVLVLQEEHGEDWYYRHSGVQFGVYITADGRSSSNHTGADASHEATKEIGDYLVQQLSRMRQGITYTGDEIEKIIKEKVNKVDQKILAENAGTTLDVVVVLPETMDAYIFHIGDGSVYFRKTDGEMELKTKSFTDAGGGPEHYLGKKGGYGKHTFEHYGAKDLADVREIIPMTDGVLELVEKAELERVFNTYALSLVEAHIQEIMKDPQDKIRSKLREMAGFPQLVSEIREGYTNHRTILKGPSQVAKAESIWAYIEANKDSPDDGIRTATAELEKLVTTAVKQHLEWDDALMLVIDLKESRKYTAERVAGLQIELDEQVGYLETARTDLGSAQEEVARLEKELERKQEEVETADTARQTAEETLAGYEEAKVQELARIQSELKEAQGKVSELEIKVGEGETAQARLSTELETAKTSHEKYIQRTEAELEERAQLVVDADAERQKVLDTNIALQTELGVKAADIARLDGKLKEEKNNYQRYVDDTKEALAKRDQRIKEAENEKEAAYVILETAFSKFNIMYFKLTGEKLFKGKVTREQVQDFTSNDNPYDTVRDALTAIQKKGDAAYEAIVNIYKKVMGERHPMSVQKVKEDLEDAVTSMLGKHAADLVTIQTLASNAAGVYNILTGKDEKDIAARDILEKSKHYLAEITKKLELTISSTTKKAKVDDDAINRLETEVTSLRGLKSTVEQSRVAMIRGLVAAYTIFDGYDGHIPVNIDSVLALSLQDDSTELDTELKRMQDYLGERLQELVTLREVESRLEESLDTFAGPHNVEVRTFLETIEGAATLLTQLASLKESTATAYTTITGKKEVPDDLLQVFDEIVLEATKAVSEQKGSAGKIEGLETKLGERDGNISALTRERDDLQKEIAKLTTANQRQVTGNQQQIAFIERLTTSEKELLARVAKLEAELKEAKTAAEQELRARIDELEEKEATYVSRLDTLTIGMDVTVDDPTSVESLLTALLTADNEGKIGKLPGKSPGNAGKPHVVKKTPQVELSETALTAIKEFDESGFGDHDD